METVQKQRDLIEKLIRSNSKFSGNEDLFEDFCSETYKRSHSLFSSLDISHLESYISKVANTAILTVLKESGRIQRKQSKYVSIKEVSREIPVAPIYSVPQFIEPEEPVFYEPMSESETLTETPQIEYIVEETSETVIEIEEQGKQGKQGKDEIADTVSYDDFELVPNNVFQQISEHILNSAPITESFTEETTGYGSVVLYDIPDPRESFEEKIVRKDLLQKVVDVVLIEHKNNPGKEYYRIFYLRYIKEMKQKEIAQEVNISQSEVSKRLLDIARLVKKHFG